MGAEVFHHLKKVLHDKHLSTTVGDEGGFAPNLKSADEALEVLAQGRREGRLQARRAGRLRPRPGDDGAVRGGEEEGQDRLLLLQEQPGPRRLVRRDDRPVEGAVRRSGRSCSIEDGLAEDDWDGWKKLTQELGGKVQLVGDDLFVTNTKRLQRGHRRRAAATASW